MDVYTLSRPALLVVLISLIAAPWGAGAQNRERYPLPTPGVPDSLGVNIHFTDPKPGEMEQLAAAGFRWIRMDFGWSGIERTKGQYDFSAYDRLMAALVPHSIRPIFILDYGNDLYQQGSPRSPEARAAFARFAAAAVTHFKNRGILWEMYNEPNIGFWKPTPNTDEYIALALETGKAIRRAAPQEWYIGPAMSTMDFGFLEKCFQAGLLQYWDAVSFHPYRNSPPETAAPDFGHVRDLIAKYGPKGKQIPILSGEWGYSELYPGLNLEKQSKYIAREFLSDMANGLILSIWYDWHDDGVDPKETEHHFGTVYADYKPKPTYLAAKTLAQTLDGFHFNKRLALDSPEDYCLLFSDAKGDARLAVWTTAPQTHEVAVPCAGKVQVIGYTGEKSEVAADGKDRLRLTLTDAPQYIAAGAGQHAVGPLNRAAQWATLPPRLVVGDMQEAQKAFSRLTTGTWPAGDYPVLARLTLEAMGAPGAMDLDRQRKQVDFKIYSREMQPTPVPVPAFEERGAEPIRVRATLTIPGANDELAQETEIVARYPLRVTPTPVAGNTMPVRVENLSGEPFVGRIGLAHAGDASDQALRFARNETEKTLVFALPAQTGPYTAQFVIEAPASGGSAWRPVATTPALLLTPLEDFTEYAVGTTPPAADYQVVPDGDPAVHSQISWSVAPPPPGLPAVTDRAARIVYAFDPGWKFLRLAPRGEKQAPFPGEPVALGLWIYGDGSGNILNARFTDAGGQTFQTGVGPMTWKGWRYVTFSLRGGNAGHWGGADDGIVHYPIHPDTLCLVDSAGKRGGTGTVYVTGITLLSPSKQ